MDVCGAPALTRRVVEEWSRLRPGGEGGPTVAVVGGAGKSGSLSLAAARDAGAARTIGVVPHEAEADLLRGAGLADAVAVADARDPIALRDAVTAAGGPADVTVVCVDVPGCEGGAILATADGGTVVFFSMATSFSAAALGAEGLAADVTDDRRQRLRPRPRGVRPGPAASPRGRARALRAEALMGKLTLDAADVRRARTLARQVGRPIVKTAQQHTTVSVERATLRLAGLSGADAEGTPWVNRLSDVVRADVGLEHGVSRCRCGTPCSAARPRTS